MSHDRGVSAAGRRIGAFAKESGDAPSPGAGPYKGTLTIAPRGDVYDVHWVVGAAQYLGVGVVVNDTLAVTYSGAADRSWSGVIAYRQRADGALEGRWTLLAVRK